MDLKAENERLLARVAELEAMLKTPVGGHDQPCANCGKMCNGFAGNPAIWPHLLFDRKHPGERMMWCKGCLSVLVHENR